MIPRTIHRSHVVQTGPDTHEVSREKLILWNCHGDWCLVSREGAGTPDVVHRSVLDFSLAHLPLPVQPHP